jgi:predicted Zn-dependent protease
LAERSQNYIAQGKNAQARKDLERILAEDSDYPGLQEQLADLTASEGLTNRSAKRIVPSGYSGNRATAIAKLRDVPVLTDDHAPKDALLLLFQ